MKWIRENIDGIPSFSPYIDHVELIENSVNTNPTLCVETCKSLIEGLCKTILNNKAVLYRSDISFNGLVNQTISVIINSDESFRDDLTELGRRIASVSQKLGELRNNAGFASHGLDVLNPKLTETVSLFSYKITDTIGGFILRCYANNRLVSKDSRIHYDDCKPFNEKFDTENPLNIGIIELSASKILFNEDYDAYLESYYEYLDELKDQVINE